MPSGYGKMPSIDTWIIFYHFHLGEEAEAVAFIHSAVKTDFLKSNYSWKSGIFKGLTSEIILFQFSMSGNRSIVLL